MSSLPERDVTAAASVTVLMATHNGRTWLPEQLASILGQEGVTVSIVALDDESTDGTREWLIEQAKNEPRLTVLEPMGASGSAAANFYRLMLAADVPGNDLVAFADQDDVWLPGKLARHVGFVNAGADGVSSNVTAFTSSGARTLVRKDFPQREFDYLLESPGPGSTFLMTPRLVALLREQLSSPTSPAREADFHDWLVYALCRARGWTWHIDAEPTVDYRQHDHNAMGSNQGAGAALSRLQLIRQKWHRGQAILLARAATNVASDARRARLEEIIALMETRGARARLALLRLAGQLRRRPRDRTIIGLLIVLGIW